MHRETIVEEFTHQAESFNASEVARAAEALDGLVTLAAPRAGERWLDAACGPGVVSRALAPLVGSVHGVDTTPAMLDVARREADARGLGNVTFALGDATALDAEHRDFDGALARFALHHVPVPGRLVDELARVVRPGGTVVLADHLADDEAGAAAWSQELERLRDPSHWACLSLDRLRELGAAAGLELEEERIEPLLLDYEDWLARGSGGAAARELIGRSLAEHPDGTPCFGVVERDGRRMLALRMWMARWRRAP